MNMDFKKIEKKWQKIWEDEGVFKTINNDKTILNIFFIFTPPYLN